MNNLGRHAVLEAYERIHKYVHRTPVITSRSLSEEVGAELFFKCENMQRAGAFKVRGAMNAVLSLDPAITMVATHSSGNHGAALALAARETGRKAYVVMPENSAAVKRDAVARYGATVVACGPSLADRESKLEALVASTGATFIPPYDDVHIIVGQGTAALELIDEVGELDQIWIPVGGGGLASGTVLAADGGTVIGAEPELARDAFEAMELGVRQPAMPPRTVADGLRTSLGEITFDVLYQNKTQIVLACEEGILDAMKLIWARTKLVVEPSAAVPLAAMIENPGVAWGRVGIVLTGGNIEPN
jgi:threonine dehydratase